MLFHFLYQWASLAALAIATGVGFWRGGWPERVSGVAMILAWLATALLYNSIQLHGTEVGPVLADVFLMLVLLYVALKSDRWWPMWACAFQALNVVLHFALAADAVLWRRAAWMASSAFSYLIMLSLFLGSVRRPLHPARPDAASPLT